MTKRVFKRTAKATVDAPTGKGPVSLRNIDLELWRELRLESLRRGVTLTTAIAEAARLWLATPPADKHA